MALTGMAWLGHSTAHVYSQVSLSVSRTPQSSGTQSINEEGALARRPPEAACLREAAQSRDSLPENQA